MGIMADRLDAMVINVSSPDGQVHGELRDRDAITVSFQDNSYRHYTERGMEHQLSRLAVLLWTGYQRGYDAALTEATGQPVTRSTETWDANRRRFRDEQAKTVAKGMSKEGYIYVETTGMLSWQIVIRDGTLKKLDETQFAEELIGAYHAMSAEYRAKLSRLRAKHFGVSFQT
ncbi:MAG: hypothetical protein ACRD0P_17125 [Stackebrandtia sp.]